MVTISASPRPRISLEAVGPATSTGKRFTVDGSAALEEHLSDCCKFVKTSVLGRFSRHIEGLLLGGGYGRGEGGVLQSDTGEQPYNDLEFYLFVHGNPRLFEYRFGTELDDLRHQLSDLLSIEIEFKVMSLAQLRRAPLSMFFYDMIAGHRWLVGTDELFAECGHQRAAHILPLCESTRLLMNRYTGLLFAREQLAASPFKPENADFIRRNINKAQLAFGDAVLAAFGRYHWSCRERHQRLDGLKARLPWHSELVERHQAGVAFKLQPWRSDESPEQLGRDLEKTIAFARELWLWLESKRLHHAFISARHYALNPLNKWPDTPRLRNLLINFKAFKRPVLRNAIRHPRERVLESLALLLWEPAALTESTLRERLKGNLRARITTFSSGVAAYRRVWLSVN